jgi:hypothetical protein
MTSASDYNGWTNWETWNNRIKNAWFAFWYPSNSIEGIILAYRKECDRLRKYHRYVAESHDHDEARFQAAKALNDPTYCFTAKEIE